MKSLPSLALCWGLHTTALQTANILLLLSCTQGMHAKLKVRYEPDAGIRTITTARDMPGHETLCLDDSLRQPQARPLAICSRLQAQLYGHAVAHGLPQWCAQAMCCVGWRAGIAEHTGMVCCACLKRRSWKACSRMQAPVSRMKVAPSWHPSSCIVCMVFSRHSALCTQDMQACIAGNLQAALETKDLFHASKSLCSLIIWHPDRA